jgi:L-amino acid N-acyltransferase YncA
MRLASLDLSEPVVIRFATVADAVDIATIYAPYVRETAISFETEPPTPAEMATRIVQTLETYPFVVSAGRDGVEGYAFAGPHRARPSYRFSVDVSVYVAPDHHGRGIGRALYGELLGVLRRQGFQAAFAGIALPNAASVGLHEAVGFGLVGIYRKVGFKFGVWHDVGWWQVNVGNHPVRPIEPRSLRELLARP